MRLPFNLGEFVNASLDEIARYLETLREGLACKEESFSVPGITPWLRFLDHMWIPATLCLDTHNDSLFPVHIDDSLAPLPSDIREKLATENAPATGATWLVVLPSDESPEILRVLLTAAKRLLDADAPSGLIVLQGSVAET